MDNEKFIKHCLDMAEKGQGSTGINPLVGACLVRDEKIVAETYHSGYGKPHAEQQLLNKSEQKISSKDVLFVNLEPCCHHGKTPPCTDIIIKKGIKNVIYGIRDPDPRVAGKGIEQLRKAGVNVVGPVMPELCSRINRGYVCLKEKGRPWITVKKAVTKQGKIAGDNGSKIKITTEQQDSWSHLNLRATHNAILVGVNTVITDNPQLTVRQSGEVYISPLRIILDPNLKIPIDAKVVNGQLAKGTVVMVSGKQNQPAKQMELQSKGVKLLPITLNSGKFDFDELFKILTSPADSFKGEHPLGIEFIGITSILVEGGGRTWEFFINQSLVDEMVILTG